MYILDQYEVERRIRFDLAKVKYTVMYGDSIFVKCKTCKGTGLSGITSHFGGECISWDCSSYCSDCEGFGGMFILGETIFKCNMCDGRGDVRCTKCSGTGYVDFLENILFQSDSSYNWESRIPIRTKKDGTEEIGW